MMRRVRVHANEDACRAAFAVLEEVLHSDHPMVQRAVEDAVEKEGRTRYEAVSFAALLGIAIASDTAPRGINAHAREA